MIEVIQIYKSKEIFEKPSYTPENRRRFHGWYEEFESSNGFVRDGVLYLPMIYRDHPELKTASLVVLQDVEGFNPYLQNKYCRFNDSSRDMSEKHKHFLACNQNSIWGFHQLNHPKAFELFRIQKTQSDCFFLNLDYQSNDLIIGLPKRENHKFAELRLNKPIRYRINGQSDFTMTGRKRREFYEFDYLFEVLEPVDRIEFLELNKIQTTKTIPLTACKLVDERKMIR